MAGVFFIILFYLLLLLLLMGRSAFRPQRRAEAPT
jgi:cbb3-type cytochrome oxidase subunit 3